VRRVRHASTVNRQSGREYQVLTSLFGDLGPAKTPRRASVDAADGGFAATAIMESVATEVNARGQMVDRHSHDLVVTGSPAQAIREHFADTRSDLDTATSLITLLDPAGMWASAVIKALSDAGGRPIERLHLREHSTLRTLATIERTTLVRRHEDALRVYHADVRAPGSENAEIPIALMERSQMTTVIVGPLQPHAIDALISALYAASMLPTWRCPNLLFMLPPNAVWIANKIAAIAWPGRLHVHVLSESLTGASSVWNAMLGMWNQVRAQSGWEPSGSAMPAGVDDLPIGLAALTSAEPGTKAAAPALPRLTRHALDLSGAQRALASLIVLDGLTGCAVVESTTGLVLAREMREQPAIDMDIAAAACAQALRAHRQAALSMGLGEQVDEVVISAGPRQQVLRTVSRYPHLFMVALLDKHRTNLALVRYRLMELARELA
jgi:predicted regulator of Ras-like GTPase activity (Roadblock/LC7/MglB family)